MLTRCLSNGWLLAHPTAGGFQGGNNGGVRRTRGAREAELGGYSSSNDTLRCRLKAFDALKPLVCVGNFLPLLHSYPTDTVEGET